MEQERSIKDNTTSYHIVHASMCSVTVFVYHIICTSTSLHASHQQSIYIALCFLCVDMAQKYVDDKVAQNKVMVFSKSYCPYCKMAKDVLNEVGVKYGLVELDERGKTSKISFFSSTML